MFTFLTLPWPFGLVCCACVESLLYFAPRRSPDSSSQLLSPTPSSPRILRTRLQVFSFVTAFIRKVYAVLCIQLGVTTAFLFASAFIPAYKSFLMQNRWVVCGSMIVCPISYCRTAQMYTYPYFIGDGSHVGLIRLVVPLASNEGQVSHEPLFIGWLGMSKIRLLFTGL